MANTDAPRGFTPVGTISGSAWTGKVRTFQTDGGEALFKGDAVALDVDGFVRPANAAEPILGVCVGVLVAGVTDDNFIENGNLGVEEHPGYAPSGSTTSVLVSVGPDVLYAVQDNASGSAGGTSNVYIGSTAEILPTAGSTTTGRSAHEIVRSDFADAASAEQVQVVDYVRRPDNSALEDNAEWIVRINEHVFGADSSGIA